MASLITTAGLVQSGQRTFGIAGSTIVQSMAWDDATGASQLGSTHTKLSDATNFTTFLAAAFDGGFPASTGTTVQAQATLTTGQFNGKNIGRITLHYLTAASVTSITTSLYGGIDAQLIAKTSDFSLITRVDVGFRST